MAIVIDKDAGLIQGLQTAGNALAATLTHNALMRAQEKQQRQQQAQYAQLASKLQGKPIDQDLIFSLLAEPGGMEALKTLGPLLGGVLKENARSAGAENWLQNAVLQAIGGQPQNPQNPEAPQMPYGINQGIQSAGQGVLDSVMGSLTPIDQPMNDGYHLNKDFYERNGLAKPDISDLQEWRSGTLNAPAVSGVPSAPPLPDENRVGPREQTKFQMGGQSGMDLHPPQENFQQVPIKQPIPQISDLNTDQQEKLAQILSGSPYQQHRDRAKNIQDQLKQNTRNFHEDRKYHTDLAKKGLEHVNSLRESLPRKAAALQMARNAVQSGEVGAFSKANLAQILGRPELQNASGSALLTASKENLLSIMARVSGRAQNQWFERRASSMFAQIGQSKEANLTAQEMLEGEMLLDEAYLNAYDKIADEDVKKYGYVKGDIEKKARDSIKDDETKIFDRSVYRMRQLEEKEMGDRKLQANVGKGVESGTPLTLEMARNYIKKYGSTEKALEIAKKNGYTVPTKSELEFYQMSPQQIRAYYGSR